MRPLIRPSLFTLTMLSVCATAQASDTGWFLGAEAGYAKFRLKQINVTINAANVLFRPQNDSGAVGLKGGYNFSKYFAAGVAYHYFQPTSYNGDDSTLGGPPTVTHQTFSFYGKLIMPIYHFNFFVRAGYVYAEVKESGILDTSENKRGPTSSQNAGIFGAGITYNITPSVEVGGSINRMTGPRETANTFMMASLSYHFVTQYCGDFIC